MIDFSLKVTAASSEVDKVGSIFLQLKLVVNKNNKLENVFMGKYSNNIFTMLIHFFILVYVLKIAYADEWRPPANPTSIYVHYRLEYMYGCS